MRDLLDGAVGVDGDEQPALVEIAEHGRGLVLEGAESLAYPRLGVVGPCARDEPSDDDIVRHREFDRRVEGSRVEPTEQRIELGLVAREAVEQESPLARGVARAVPGPVR